MVELFRDVQPHIVLTHISGMEEVRYAEAFQRTLPWVVKSL